MSHTSPMQDFLRRHRLPSGYLTSARCWFEPLAGEVARHRAEAGRPLVVGINGCQGSGKSTLASFLSLILQSVHGLKVIDLSIDDFYLTRGERQALARSVHPLLATRGVPGTHDTALMARTLESLCDRHAMVPIPRFDKLRDDRRPVERWQQVKAPVDVVILEGWCLGTPPEPPEALAEPVNELERREDPDGRWRRYVNERLRLDYPPIHDKVDLWVMLQAPSFECVFRWRLEQERKLAARQAVAGGAEGRVMSPDEVTRFIQHYQRLTQRALEALPPQVHYLYRLDSERRITEAGRPRAVALP